MQRTIKQPLLLEEAAGVKLPAPRVLPLLVTTLVVIFFTSAALYWGLHSWLADGTDRNAIHREELRKDQVTSNLLLTQRLVDRNAQQEAMIDMMTSQLNGIVINDTAALTDPTIALFHSINATIQAANNSCNSQLLALNTVLAQLIQGSNATTIQLLGGTCDMSAINNGNETLSGLEFTYNRLSIVGLDFYFYVIQPYTGPNATLVVGTGGARFDNFSPPVMQGSVVESPVFRAQLSSKLVGSPLSPEDYILYLLTGEGAFSMLPIETGASPEQTLELVAPLTIFVSFV